MRPGTTKNQRQDDCISSEETHKRNLAGFHFCEGRHNTGTRRPMSATKTYAVVTLQIILLGSSAEPVLIDCPRGHARQVRTQFLPRLSLSYVMAFLKITDASGRQWQYDFVPLSVCSIGRAPDNTIVLDDPRASRTDG